MTRAVWFGRLPAADQRCLRQLATVDAARTPLPTPTMEAWRRHGCHIGGAIWAAACWEAAAVAATSASGRINALMMARAIIAEAKGEVTSRARAAA